MNQVNESVIDAERRSLFDWAELWRYRELFYFFTWRDIKIKYKQTVLGFVWVVLQPLLMMIIFTLFFGRALNVPSQNLPYPIFVFSGLLVWNMFSAGLTSSANSMVNNSQIIKKIYFPRLVVPGAALLVSLFDFLMSFILFIGLLIIYGQEVSFHAIWAWPMSILLALVATLGPGSWLAALNIKYRDFRYVVPFLIQVLFFLTPVIYPVTFLKHDILQYLLACNPIYGAIELFRFPLNVEAGLNLNYFLISGGSCLIILMIGVVYFRKTENFFADLG